MSNNRLYSDQEISSIIKRAGEIQATQSPEETHGLSLSEIQQIAAEVGLDPKIVAMAASELERAGVENKSAGLLGASSSLYIERVLPGEIDEKLLPEVAAKIGQEMGMVGRSGQVGKSLEWTHSSERSHFQVTVTPQNGQTKVRVIGKYPRIALAFFLPALIIGGIWTSMIPLAMQAAPAMVTVIALIGLTIGYFISRFAFSRYVRKRERSAENLVQALSLMIDDSREHEAEKQSSREARIELPEDEAPEDGQQSRGTRTESQSQ